MGKLIIDHKFTGFTEDVGIQIFQSSKRRRKHPARCTNGGEPFEINGVRSLGASYQVRTRNGMKWVQLKPMAVIEWLSEDGVYGSNPIAEQLANRSSNEDKPNDVLHRANAAVQCLSEAQSLVDGAARNLWGLKEFEAEYEYLLRDSHYLDIAQKKIKQRFGEVVQVAETSASIVSRNSEICPACGGQKFAEAVFCNTLCWVKVPQELKRSLRKSVGELYENAFAEALRVLGVATPILPQSDRVDPKHADRLPEPVNNPSISNV